MALPNIFSKTVTDELVQRINRLTPGTTPQWGKMNVAQMLAHCNVTYEMAFEDIHPKPNAFVKLILKLLLKPKVVSETPYGKNGQTAPAFIITDERVFEAEKQRLIAYLHKAQQLGEAHFVNQPSHSFGTLSATEWNNMFYKHLDHHLGQFGV